MKVEKLEETIAELKMNQSKIESDLENCKITESALITSQQETKECCSDNVSNRELILELKVNQTKLSSELETYKRTDADLNASRQETKECTKQLEDKNLKCRYDNLSNGELILELKQNQTKLSSELETYKSTDTERELNDCNAQLKDSINGKQDLQKKYELVCPWSEWSSCSKTCWGTKTRTDTCSNSDEQIKACNQFSSCPRSGK